MTLNRNPAEANPAAAYDAHVNQMVDLFGWHATFVEGGGVPYVHSVGLSARGLPELLLQGVEDRRTAHAILTCAVDAALAGTLDTGDMARNTGVLSGYAVVLRPLHADYTHLIGAAHRYAQQGGLPGADACVVALPDAAGAFPWEGAYDHETEQPAIWARGGHGRANA